MIRKVAWITVVVFAFGFGHGAAQTLMPDGSFVRDSAGNVWLVYGGWRSAVPIYPATDEQIAAVPDGGQWVVPGADGRLTLGARPSWAGSPPIQAVAPGAAPPTVLLEDALPNVTIQLNDDRINSGQSLTVTLIATDDKGVEEIEWEGTILDNENDNEEADDDTENDNRATGDKDLDERHRHDCDDLIECANIWTVKPTVTGDFTIRARATDTTGQRSEWKTVELRVR
jgi:hypothetical protein